MGNQAWITDFEGYARPILEKYKVPGTAIGIAQHGKLLYQQGIGYRNIEAKQPVTEDTIFGIASITKSFTAIAIMQLQEAGKLSVHDPVNTYLPEFKTPDPEHTKKVTIHHFLTHTAGLPPLPTLYHAMARTMENDPSVSEKHQEQIKARPPLDTYEQLMQYIGELEFDILGEPGTQFSYSNDSYALLGAIIERVSEMPYDIYVSKHILKPARMLSSTFDLSIVQQADDVTTLYATRPTVSEEELVHHTASDADGATEVYESPGWWDSPAMLAGGFLRSTLKDMLRYTEIFRNDGVVGETRILSVESVNQMIKPHIQYQQNKYYGYGLMVTPNVLGGTLVEHGGSLKAISSHMSIIPEKGIAGIILTNLVGVPVSTILLGALNALQSEAPNTPLVQYEDYIVTTEQLQQYVGTYASGEGAEMTVTLEDGQLYFSNQDKPLPMRPVGEHLFTIEMNETEAPLRFLFNHQNELYGLFLGVRQILKVNS